jgi:hypothetical protein
VQPVRLERTPCVHRPCCPPKPLEDRKLHGVSTTAIAFVPLRRNAKLTCAYLTASSLISCLLASPQAITPAGPPSRLT